MVRNKKSTDSGELVVAGWVKRAWGVRGCLSVVWNNGACPVKVGSGRVFLQPDGSFEKKSFVVRVDNRHGRVNLVTLDGVVSRTDAEKLQGSSVWVEKDNLPKLGNGEYYSYQILDMKVETVEGRYLGTITKIFSTGSNDVYVVTDGGKEILIPAISDVVKEVDEKNGVMKVTLLEGLE